MQNLLQPNINDLVSFSSGQVPELLKKMESYLGVALSLRSSTGEVVCKTDYFNGPCSIIRATSLGRERCRKTYHNIEKRLFQRKTPFVNVCYAGFLIFVAPLNFRGEMIGFLIGSQILPHDPNQKLDLVSFFANTCETLGINANETFYRSFAKVKTLSPDMQRISFLQYLEIISNNFIKMAFADKTWEEFLKEMKINIPHFGDF